MKALTLRMVAGAAMFVASCAGHDDQATATSSAALEETHVLPPVSAEVLVTLEAPQGACGRQQQWTCPGGYWVRALNQPARARHVSAIEVDQVPTAALEQAAGVGDHQLVLRGQFAPDARQADSPRFIAFEIWRGLPDVLASPFDETVAIERVNGQLVARLVDTRGVRPIEGVEVSGFAPPWVDTGWLTARVLQHGALVAGQLDGTRFEATQVFVRLPDFPGPCPMFLIECRGEIATYERNDERCLIPTGCAAPEACPLFLPRCEPGYRLVSWPTQPAGCPAFACDPAFLTQ